MWNWLEHWAWPGTGAHGIAYESSRQRAHSCPALYSRSWWLLCLFCLRISLLCLARLGELQGWCCFLSLSTWCLQCLQTHMQFLCAPARTLDRIISGLGTGALHPSWHWLLWQKCLSPTVSGAGPLVPEQAGCIQKPGSDWLHLLWLELLSSTLLACASCLEPWGWAPRQGTGKSAPGVVHLPMGAHLDEGSTSRERQSGGAGAALSEAGHLFLSEEKWCGTGVTPNGSIQWYLLQETFLTSLRLEGLADMDKPALEEGKSCGSLWLVYLMWKIKATWLGHAQPLFVNHMDDNDWVVWGFFNLK